MSRQLKDHLVSSGIHHRISCPYTPQQNGIAERKHMHLIELGLAMMFQSYLPLHFWVEAFYTASYISNLLPAASRNNKSPSELLLGQKPDYSHLRVLNSACYPCLRPVTDHKFEPRSLLCVFLGYSSQYKGYRCLYPPTGKVYISRHVIFDESCFPFKDQYKKYVPRYEISLLRAWQMATDQVQAPVEEQISRILPLPVVHQPAPAAPLVPVIPPPIPDNPPAVVPSPVVEAQPQVNAHPMTTRAKSGIQKPNTRYVLAASRYDIKKPRNIREAMAHPEWNGTVMEEITNVHMLHTWALVPQTDDMNVITSGWVYSTKLNLDGTVKKRRVRLVAKGYQQENA